MKRGPLIAAIASGLVVGGGVVVFLALRKARELEERGVMLQLSLERGGTSTETYLAALGGKVEDEVQRAARAEARAYVADELGLTQARIDALVALGARLGV